MPTPRAQISCDRQRGASRGGAPPQKYGADEVEPALRCADARRRRLPRAGRLGAGALPHAWRRGGLGRAARQSECPEVWPAHGRGAGCVAAGQGRDAADLGVAGRPIKRAAGGELRQTLGRAHRLQWHPKA